MKRETRASSKKAGKREAPPIVEPTRISSRKGKPKKMEIEDVVVNNKLEEKLEEDRLNRNEVLIFDKAH